MSDLHELLLQQMLSGYQPSNDELSRMFAEHEDPRFRLVAQFMNQKAAAPIADTEFEEASLMERDPPPSPSPSSRLRSKIHKLSAELHEAQSIADTLAAALGACYLCWGGDPHCEHCGGAGVTGWSELDSELFAVYVAPAIERFHKTSHDTDLSESTK